MPPTLSWPANPPSYRTTSGSPRPCRASARSRRVIVTKVDHPAGTGPPVPSAPGGVPSHSISQSTLRRRADTQDGPSRNRSGRTVTGPSVSVAGQPAAPNPTVSGVSSLVVATTQLGDGVSDHRLEHGDAVPHTAGRPRQVDDDGRPG